MRPTPISPDALADLLTELCLAALPGDGPARPRVAIDGAPVADGRALADTVADQLERRGVPALRVSTDWFLRPASLRFEHGRHDPLSYAEEWLDVGALRREVLDPLGPGGSGRWLPTRWDPDWDRATREPYRQAPERAVLLLDGWLLFDRSLPFDLCVHLWMSMAALRRRTPEDQRWTLPAYQLYAGRFAPAGPVRPDVLVRCDDPRHPAVEVRPPE